MMQADRILDLLDSANGQGLLIIGNTFEVRGSKQAMDMGISTCNHVVGCCLSRLSSFEQFHDTMADFR